MAVNSLAVLAAAKLTGADLARAALALAQAAPAKRGCGFLPVLHPRLAEDELHAWLPFAAAVDRLTFLNDKKFVLQFIPGSLLRSVHPGQNE